MSSYFSWIMSNQEKVWPVWHTSFACHLVAIWPNDTLNDVAPIICIIIWLLAELHLPLISNNRFRWQPNYGPNKCTNRLL